MSILKTVNFGTTGTDGHHNWFVTSYRRSLESHSIGELLEDWSVLDLLMVDCHLDPEIGQMKSYEQNGNLLWPGETEGSQDS